MTKYLKNIKMPKLETIADFILNLGAIIVISLILYFGIVLNLGV